MKIAHLSDVHLIAPRRSSTYAIRTRMVSFGRSSDPVVRAQKLTAALAAARASGAEHVVVSGDLTELGDDAEYALFAEVLAEAGLADDAVTLIPGNHDAYTHRDAWARALGGPLSRWAKTSAPPRGEGIGVVDLGDVVLLPIDVTKHQSIFLSGGELDEDAARTIDAKIDDARTTALVIHHPPFPKRDSALLAIVDALRGSERVTDLLARHPRLHLMHGHHHRHIDRPRIFGAPGVADDRDVARVRLYETAGDGLVSAVRAA